MPYDWKTIFHDWLLRADVDYSQNTCIEAFDTVERMLGASWIDSFAKGARGLAVTIPLVELGKTLASIEPIRGARLIIQRIMKDRSLGSAYSEAYAIAFFKSLGFGIAISPKLRVDGSIKTPDFAVLTDRTRVYAEVSRPEHSKDQSQLEHNLISIQDDLMKVIPEGTHAEIFFYKEPSIQETRLVVSSARDSVGIGESERRIEGLAQIFVGPLETDRSTLPGGLHEKRPILFVTGIKRRGSSMSKVAVGIPFTDQRAQRIFNRESKHFSRNSTNLLILDVSRVPGGINSWTHLMSSRLQPKLNRRVGAVFMTQYAIGKRRMERHSRLLVHPSPYTAIPQKLLQIMQGSEGNK